jgi:hypothetical protein
MERAVVIYTRTHALANSVMLQLCLGHDFLLTQFLKSNINCLQLHVHPASPPPLQVK